MRRSSSPSIELILGQRAEAVTFLLTIFVSARGIRPLFHHGSGLLDHYERPIASPIGDEVGHAR
jgi:hypothetical protein